MMLVIPRRCQGFVGKGSGCLNQSVKCSLQIVGFPLLLSVDLCILGFDLAVVAVELSKQ